jgi:glycosyltransferase involved in cell wall biosynthesis
MIALDVSRLLSRAGRGTPTGIDRVEFAYARHLIAKGSAAACFAAVTPIGRLGVLPGDGAKRFVDALAASWRGDSGDSGSPASERRVRHMALCYRAGLLVSRERTLAERLRRDAPSAYLLVSHHHLENRALIARFKAHSGARFVCLIHDLIPMQFPEYAKPGQAENHARRIRTAVEFADGFIVNSSVTRDALQQELRLAGRDTPLLVAPFGADLPAAAADRAADADATPPPPTPPYFVYVSTIEARKNHILLLNLWRQLAADLGAAAAPRLVLIGQRGWETENVVDMLDRCPAVHATVIEHNNLPDAAMARLLRGATAVLLPSFAEGFGFPVIEALSLGVPVLCSDIPALRETGGGVPEFFDPLDGPGWRAAILDYAAAHSPRRAAQLARLADWRAPRWEDHFAMVDAFIAARIATPASPAPQRAGSRAR